VSLSTVACHRKHLCRKLDRHSTPELVAYGANLRRQEPGGLSVAARSATTASP
jgi:hypothetical protein